MNPQKKLLRKPTKFITRDQEKSELLPLPPCPMEGTQESPIPVNIAEDRTGENLGDVAQARAVLGPRIASWSDESVQVFANDCKRFVMVLLNFAEREAIG